MIQNEINSVDLKTSESNTATEITFDIDKGLSSKLKSISSKYLYDDLGSTIFQQIMNMAEYYPTASEFEILAMQSDKISEALAFKSTFNIVELGAGDGIKTRQLLKHLLSKNIDFIYVPIDISEKAISDLKANMLEALPELRIKPLVGDYFTMLQEVSKTGLPSLYLFLGSNIGNYQPKATVELLNQFHEAMETDDKILIGFDLQKHPKVIRLAYDDPHGITKSFNMNLLNRLNKELDANFQLNQFDFYCHYDPITGEVRSYLVSLKDQQVFSKKLKKTYSFHQNELIWTELSRKYTIEQIEQIATENHFRQVAHFLDCKHYFVDSLWVK